MFEGLVRLWDLLKVSRRAHLPVVPLDCRHHYGVRNLLQSMDLEWFRGRGEGEGRRSRCFESAGFRVLFQLSSFLSFVLCFLIFPFLLRSEEMKRA